MLAAHVRRLHNPQLPSTPLKDGLFAAHAEHLLTCALMVPGFRVAAAAVETEADLRELTIDDWDSALEEAGDTLVVVDFFTNW